MSGFDYFKRCFNRYADFQGRSRRSEFWYFYLFYLLIFYGSFVMIMFLGFLNNLPFLLAVPILFAAASIIPSLAVTVRRLHDTGKSGWFMLIGLVPIAGPIALLVFYCQDSEPGSNQWGPNPKSDPVDTIDHLIEHF